MSIDTQSDTRINIKDLVTENPKKVHESPFDLQEVSKDQWDAMFTLSKNALAQMLTLRPEQENDPESDFLHKSIRGLAVVAPEKVQDFVDDESWEILMSQMRRWDYQTVSRFDPVFSFFEKAVCLKLLSPQRAANTAIITDTQWTAITEDFKIRNIPSNNAMLRGALSMAAEVRLLDPEMAQLFNFDDERREIIEKSIKEYEQRMHEQPHSEPGLIHLLKDYKIVEPERFKTLKISDASWEKIWKYERSQIKRLLDVDIEEASHGSFASNAASYLEEVAFLSADEIQVTDSGVKFIHNKPQGSLQDPSGKMPEQRKF